MNNPIRILFLCTGNPARSQMAEGLLCNLGGERYDSSERIRLFTALHTRP